MAFIFTFTPTGGIASINPPLSGLVLWLDAADETTITKDESENVSAWSDKSSTGAVFGTITGTAPVFSSTFNNNLPAVFINITSALSQDGAQTDFWGAGGNGTITIFVVNRFANSVNSGGNSFFMFDPNSSGAFLTTGFAGFNGGDNIRLGRRGLLHSWNIHPTIATTELTNLDTVRVDGVATALESWSNTTADTFGATHTDGSSFQTNALRGASVCDLYTSELLIYDVALSDGDVLDVQTQLANKWGI